MSSTTVAGLPRFVTLRARDEERRPLHFLWFDESYPEFHKRMGIKQVVDEVSPFAKIEVVPSTTDPSFIHLRSSFNGKFCELIDTRSILYLSATADSPDEDRSKPTCTLFKPVFHPGQPRLVSFVYVPIQTMYIFIINNIHFTGYRVAGIWSLQGFFEFAPWESYNEKMEGKDRVIESMGGQIRELQGIVVAIGVEIEKLKGEVGAKEEEIEKLKGELGAKDEEIEKLKSEVGAKGEEIEKLKGEVGVKDEEIRLLGGQIEKLKGEVEGLKLYVEEREVKLDEEMVKLQSATTSAWEAFQDNLKRKLL